MSIVKTFDEMNAEQRLAYKIGFDAARRDLQRQVKCYAGKVNCKDHESMWERYVTKWRATRSGEEE